MAINAESEFGVPPRKLHPIATLSPSTSCNAVIRARSRWRWRVVAGIDVPRIVHFDLDNGYVVKIAFVPYGLPDDHAWRGLYDDRLIAVPAMAGSVWMTLFTAEDQRCAGAATFAADALAVRCDTITIGLPFRRRGLASRLYELAGSLFEASVVPGALLSADAIAFWRARLAKNAEVEPC